MAADFPDGALEHAPARSRRLTALAGSATQAVFGLGLLGTLAAVGERWGPIVQETVFLFGVLHVAALTNLRSSNRRAYSRSVNGQGWSAVGRTATAATDAPSSAPGGADTWPACHGQGVLEPRWWLTHRQAKQLT